jgi:ribosomal protein L44E
MAEHYTRSTISAALWCPKCQKQTQHRIDDRRKGPCLVCIAKLDEQHAQKPAPTQGNLFTARTP